VREDSVVSEYDNPDFELDQARRAVEDYVENRLSDYNVEFGGKEIAEIVDTCSLSRILRENQDRSEDYSTHSGGGRVSSLGDAGAIDDLFDRTP